MNNLLRNTITLKRILSNELLITIFLTTILQKYTVRIPETTALQRLPNTILFKE